VQCSESDQTFVADHFKMLSDDVKLKVWILTDLYINTCE